MLLFTLPIIEFAALSNDALWAIFGVIVGSFLSGFFQLITVNRKIYADRKRHKEDRWWNMKFGFFKDIEKTFSHVGKAIWHYDDEDFENFKHDLEEIILKCPTIFDDEEVANDLIKFRLALMGSKQSAQTVETAKKIAEPFIDAMRRCKKELGIG